MSERFNPAKYAAGAFEALLSLEKYLAQSGFDRKLMLLVKLRLSQINGCSYCVDMHSRDARLAGESERRVDVVAGWHDSPVFSEREKAAFAWAEAVNDIARTRAPDDVWERVRAHFSEKEISDLTCVVAAINAWNRMAIAFRSPPPKTWPQLPSD